MQAYLPALGSTPEAIALMLLDSSRPTGISDLRQLLRALRDWPSESDRRRWALLRR